MTVNLNKIDFQAVHGDFWKVYSNHSEYLQDTSAAVNCKGTAGLKLFYFIPVGANIAFLPEISFPFHSKSSDASVTTDSSSTSTTSTTASHSDSDNKFKVLHHRRALFSQEWFQSTSQALKAAMSNVQTDENGISYPLDVPYDRPAILPATIQSFTVDLVDTCYHVGESSSVNTAAYQLCARNLHTDLAAASPVIQSNVDFACYNENAGKVCEGNYDPMMNLINQVKKNPDSMKIVMAAPEGDQQQLSFLQHLLGDKHTLFSYEHTSPSDPTVASGRVLQWTDWNVSTVTAISNEGDCYNVSTDVLFTTNLTYCTNNNGISFQTNISDIMGVSEIFTNVACFTRINQLFVILCLLV